MADADVTAINIAACHDGYTADRFSLVQDLINSIV